VCATYEAPAALVDEAPAALPVLLVVAAVVEGALLEVVEGVGLGIVLKLMVLAPGMGTRTVALGPKISVLAKVLHKLLAGGTAAPCPGIGWLSDAQDSKTPSRAPEGALNWQPWVSKMC
jgi:hypothetical protein